MAIADRPDDVKDDVEIDSDAIRKDVEQAFSRELARQFVARKVWTWISPKRTEFNQDLNSLVSRLWIALILDSAKRDEKK